MKISFLFVLLFAFAACGKDDLIVLPPKPPEVPLSPKQECIVDEILNDSTTGFLIFETRSQDSGKLKGIKINEVFEAGIELRYRNSQSPDEPDSLLSIIGGTVGTDMYPSLGESFGFLSIPFLSGKRCFPLTSSRSVSDSVRFIYLVEDFDVLVLNYKMDYSFENHFYLDTFNAETGHFRGYFSARMIADTGYLPEIPQIIEFIDVEMTAP